MAEKELHEAFTKCKEYQIARTNLHNKFINHQKIVSDVIVNKYESLLSEGWTQKEACDYLEEFNETPDLFSITPNTIYHIKMFSKHFRRVMNRSKVEDRDAYGYSYFYKIYHKEYSIWNELDKIKKSIDNINKKFDEF